MADPGQTPKRGEWVCPCNGCKMSRKLALKQVQDILNKPDIMHSWHEAQEFIREELKKK